MSDQTPHAAVSPMPDSSSVNPASVSASAPELAGVSQQSIDDAKAAAPVFEKAVQDPSFENVLGAVQAPETAIVLRDVKTVVKETKSGFKTTEFWLTLAGLAALNLNGVVMTLPDKWQAVGSAVLAGLYALSRGQAKKGVPAETLTTGA